MHWIAIYSLDSVIQPLNNRGLVDSVIHLSNTPSQVGNLIGFLISLRLLQQWAREGRQELTQGASEGLEGTR